MRFFDVQRDVWWTNGILFISTLECNSLRSFKKLGSSVFNINLTVDTMVSMNVDTIIITNVLQVDVNLLIIIYSHVHRYVNMYECLFYPLRRVWVSECLLRSHTTWVINNSCSVDTMKVAADLTNHNTPLESITITQMNDKDDRWEVARSLVLHCEQL